jgi:sugar lactone lactonase YvrE
LLSGLTLAALAATGLRAAAVSTATFDVSTFSEMDAGEPQGTFVSSEGEVLAGRASRRLKAPDTTLVWTSARVAGRVYFGTGDQGHLLAVDGDRVRRVADLKTLLITALTPGPGGKLLAGTMPGARILEVDPKNGRWRQLAKLPTQHVWDLLYDARAGRIYAASGAPGKVFELPARGGKPRVYYDPGEKHILCLARDAKGALLAGSSDKAILYRITARDRATAVADFDANELQDVAVGDDGTIFLAANQFRTKTSGLPRYDHPQKGEGGEEIKAPKGKSGKRTRIRPQELRPGAKEGKGAVYRIRPNGIQEQLLALDKGYFTDLAVDPAGLLWAAEGTKGKVYLVRPDRTVLTAFDLPERQALALAVDGKQQYIGTGDAGAIYRISPGPGPKPAYLSKVLDAKNPARWGTLRYKASGRLRIESRSGNTAKPDKTWTDWRAAAGANAETGRVTSPGGRYLQLRMTWPRPYRAVLRSFSVYYRPQNQRARVEEITFEHGKKDKDKPRLPKIKIKWKVENPDDDPLVYRVYVRQELGRLWRKISGREPLEKTEYEWDTEAVPDGHYRVRVAASDERANGQQTTRIATRISERLLVDNRRPQVLAIAVAYPWASAEARDSYSVIKSVEFSVDSGPWRLVDPRDGLFDSPTEVVRIKLPADLSRGPHVLAVRAVDAADNMGVAQFRFNR